MNQKALKFLCFFISMILMLLIFSNTSISATVPTGYTGVTVSSETELGNKIARENVGSKNAYLIKHSMLRGYARLLCANEDQNEPAESYYTIDKINEYGWTKDSNGKLVYREPKEKLGKKNNDTGKVIATQENADAISYILYRSKIQSSIKLDVWTDRNGKNNYVWKDDVIGWTHFGTGGYSLRYYPVQGALWKELDKSVKLSLTERFFKR